MVGRSPHMYLLMRSRTAPMLGQQAMAINASPVRGGFARPDPKPYNQYKYTRRYKLEDINTTLYSDFAPEYHMHLHSVQIQHSKQGYALLTAYFFLIIFPCWLVARWLHKLAGSMMYPSVRPGSDHDHMAPALLSHLKNNNFETMNDRLGRQGAVFYRNWTRQIH